MPAVRSGSLRGTRAPEGSAPARQYPEATYPEVPLWPGITWGRDARCSCSWSVRYGVMQVKVRSAACTVHVPGRKPQAAGPLPPAPGDEALLAACRAGTVTWELYEASVRSWRRERRASLLAASLRPLIGEALDAVEHAAAGRAAAREPAGCGTRGGYERHLSDGTPTCPPCRKAKRKPGGRALARREAA